MKLTLKRSPRQVPMCFPWITSSGEQYVPQEDSVGLAADTAQIRLFLGRFTNMDPDSQVYKQKTSLLKRPAILAKVASSLSAYRYSEGKEIKLGAPWSEKNIKTLSLDVVFSTLPVPLPATAVLLPSSTARNRAGFTSAPLQSILTPVYTSTPGCPQLGLLNTFPGKGLFLLLAISSQAKTMILSVSNPLATSVWQAWKTSA